MPYVTLQSTVKGAPFIMLENGTWTGFCIDMIKELSVRIGFRSVFTACWLTCLVVY